MATCKAVAFDPLKAICKQDPEKAAIFLEGLSESNRDIYTKSLSVMKVPIKIMMEIMGVFVKMFYPEHPHPMRHLGLISAKTILTGVYKIFTQISTPAFIISRAPMIWRTYYDEGKVVIENVNAKSATMLICNFPDISTDLCEFIAGYSMGVLEIGGAKNILIVKNEPGSDCRRYDFQWK